MREGRAQLVLVVRAFEEVDRKGTILPEHARSTATRRALAVTGLADRHDELATARSVRSEETIFRRARLLFDVLGRRFPMLVQILMVARHGSGVPQAIVAGAFVAGLLTNALGPERRINLLSVPLLGILAWNLAVYVLSVVSAATILARRRAARRRSRQESDGERVPIDPSGGLLVRRLAAAFLRWGLGSSVWSWRRTHRGSGEERRVATQALTRFAAYWHRAAGPLMVARARRMLHVGAICLAAGVVTGMYVRGLAFEYRATWESTLLGEGQVQTLMDVVLGPASALAGLAVPDVAPLHAPEGHGPAAVWIHLYAVTALLAVGLPRVALLVVDSLRCRYLADRLPIDLESPYFRRLFGEWRGATTVVDLVPYSVQLGAGALGRLKAFLYEYFGARAAVRVSEPVEYGDEPPVLQVAPREEERESCHVVLFNLVQTPEIEVHGVFLEELMSRLGRERGKLLVLVDVSSYQSRVRAPERRQERLRAWRRVVEETGLAAVEVNLDQSLDDRALAEIGLALWPKNE